MQLALEKSTNIYSVVAEGTLKILVGSNLENGDGRTFHVYKLLLQKHSRYFRALGNFKEGQENLVEFEDISPSAFALLVRWLHCEKLGEQTSSEPMDVLIEAYAIGERFLITPFKDSVITYIQRAHLDGKPVSKADLDLLQELGFEATSPVITYFGEKLAYRATKHFRSSNELSSADRDVFYQGGSVAVRAVERILEREQATLQVHEGEKSAATLTDCDPAAAWICQYHEHEHPPACEGDTLYEKDPKSVESSD